jgi:multiple sugar transport system permease protein
VGIETDMNSNVKKGVTYAILIVYSIFCLFPIYWLASTSLKPFTTIFTATPTYLFPIDTVWYQAILTYIPSWKIELATTGAITAESGGWYYIVPYLINSAIIATAATLITVFIAAFAAYGFSRFDFKSKQTFQFMLLSTRFAPPIAILLPFFIIYSHIGLRDTLQGLVLLYTFFNMSIAVLLMKSFIDDIPKDYDESSILDGAGRFQTFIRVILPTARYGFAATAILIFIFNWNEFIAALILTFLHARTLPVAMSTFVTAYGTEWGMISAAGIVAILPVFIFALLTQRYLVRGLTFGTVKG